MTQTASCSTNTPRDNFLEKIIYLIMVLTSIFVILAISLSAILRYFFHQDLPGTEELITIVSFWMYFSGAIYATKVRQQISAEMLGIFTENKTFLWVTTLLQRLITFFICLLFAWYGWDFFSWGFTSGGKTSLLSIPLWIGQISVFLGFVGMLLYLIRDIKEIFLVRKLEKKFKVL